MIKLACEICGSTNYIVHHAKVSVSNKTGDKVTVIYVELKGDICEDCFYEHKSKLIAASQKIITEDSSRIIRDWVMTS